MSWLPGEVTLRLGPQGFHLTMGAIVALFVVVADDKQSLRLERSNSRLSSQTKEALSSSSGRAHNAPLVALRIPEHLERAYLICMDRSDPDGSKGFSCGRGPRHIVHVHINM